MPTRLVSLVDLVVHELRTPLTVAIGSLRQAGVAGDDSQRAALARALRSCERIEHLAGEMRDWVRIEETPPQAAPLSLAGAVDEAITVASAARPGQVTLAAGTVPAAMVMGLPHLLPRALAALMTAVIRGVDAGTRVPVELDLVSDSVTLTIGSQPGQAAASGDDFQAECLGGLGFSLPLAHAVIAAAGGAVASASAADGRLAAITVALILARPTPPR